MEEQVPKQGIGQPYRKMAVKRAGRVQSAEPERAGRQESHPLKTLIRSRGL